MKSRFTFPAAALLVIVSLTLLAYSAMAQDPGGGSSQVTMWEHAALTHPSADVAGDAELSSKIIEMGDNGWELVSVSTVVDDGTTKSTIFYFKRPK